MPTPIRLSNWNALLHELENAFGVEVPNAFHVGTINLEELCLQMQALSNDPGKVGRFVIAFEMRQELSAMLGITDAEILDTSKMAALLPDRIQRKSMLRILQAQVDWRLPRLGLPIWGQYIWGGAMLVGFVLQFIYVFLGTILFWGGMLLSFQVEKIAWAFQYPTFGGWVQRIVELNWPALAMGAVDDERLRIAFSDVLGQTLEMGFDPRLPFPTVVVENLWQGWGPQGHLLHGDHLRLAIEESEIPGERIVMRECMCVGPIVANSDFFERRAAFIFQLYNADPSKYQQWVMQEFDRLDQLPASIELNLWFQEDLFCQCNLWFILDRLLVHGCKSAIFLVLPQQGNVSAGFAGISSLQLAQQLQARIPIPATELAHGQALWHAFQSNDVQQLKHLAQNPYPIWRCLPAVVQAHCDRQPDAKGLGKPQRILQSIIAEGVKTFPEILATFTTRAPIYGFTDLQVRELLREMGMEMKF